MNVNDISDNEVVCKGDRLEEIFSKQQELMAKYHHIEKSSGLLQTEDCPVNLHDKFGQARLKDFAWRVTEEITESTDALGEGDLHHAKEEMSDALHFCVEMCILAGLSPDDILVRAGMSLPLDVGVDMLEHVFIGLGKYDTKRAEAPLISAYASVEHFGRAMNCLKQKPWKQTHILTDTERFKDHMSRGVVALLGYASAIRMDADEVFSYYFKKNAVNQFRQASNY